MPCGRCESKASELFHRTGHFLCFRSSVWVRLSAAEEIGLALHKLSDSESKHIENRNMLINRLTSKDPSGSVSRNFWGAWFSDNIGVYTHTIFWLLNWVFRNALRQYFFCFAFIKNVYTRSKRKTIDAHSRWFTVIVHKQFEISLLRQIRIELFENQGEPYRYKRELER